MLVDQPTSTPTRKVGSGMIAGGVGAAAGAPLVILWAWELLTGQPMPTEVAVFLAGAIVWAAQSGFGYFSRERE